jgi:hypothetical protein
MIHMHIAALNAAADYFASALDGNKELQVPFHVAHVRATLLDGYVQIAEDAEHHRFGPGSQFLST